jgi:hypothetical protein
MLAGGTILVLMAKNLVVVRTAKKGFPILKNYSEVKKKVCKSQ